MFDIDLNKYRIVDLSYEVVPPGADDRPFEIEQGLLADNAYKHEVKTHSHVGTHVEAPAHFFDNAKDITELPLTAFFGRAILLEVYRVEENLAIMPAYLEEDIGGMIQEGDIVICRNNDKESIKSGTLPHLTPQAAEWFKENNIKMLGIDNNFRLSKDIPSGRELHNILMSQDIPFVEFLDNLDELTRKEFFFMALPFKVKVMDSSWARAIAIEERGM